MTNRRILMAAVGMTLAMTACNKPADSLPVQNGDEGPALQAQIDRVAAAGGGTVQLASRTYKIARPLYLRTGVTLAGQGPSTVLTNEPLSADSTWGGVTVFAGNLNPGSYSDATGEGYPAHPTRRLTSTSLEVLGCNQAQIAALPGKVVWLSTPDASFSARGRPNPEDGEITVVKSASGCRVDLADPISAAPPKAVNLFWSDGSKTLPIGVPNVPIRDAGLRDLQLMSGRSQALLVTGCYRCTFENLKIGKSRRLIALQGMRHGVYRNITGTFSERGIELAMFATQNTVEHVDAKYVPTGRLQRPLPALRFGENSHDNTLSDVTLDLGPAYANSEKIRFDETRGNTLRNIDLVVSAQDNGNGYLYRGPGSARGVRDRLPPSTRLDGVRLCAARSAQNCRIVTQ